MLKGLDPDAFRLFFEQAPGINLVLTPDFRMVAASDARLKATMLPREAVIGRYLFDVFTDNTENPAATGVRNLKASLERVLACKKPDAMPIQRYDLRRPDGTFEQRYWSPLNLPILDPAGEVIYILHQVEDVTELARLQHEVERAEAQGHELRRQLDAVRRLEGLKDEFLNSLSHELRAPLATIMATLSTMSVEAEAAGEPPGPYLASLTRNTKVLLGLVSDLLDSSRIHAGTFSLVSRPVYVPGLVAEAVSDLSHMWGAKRLNLAWTVAPDAERLLADEQRLWQVLVNLLGNAIKFTPEEGRVRLRVCRQGAVLRFEVEDSGVGIAPHELGRLFQRFTQLGDAPRHGGLGLGLSIAKAIVETHGGTIGVRSTPGEGSLFWFTLPAAA